MFEGMLPISLLRFPDRFERSRFGQGYREQGKQTLSLQSLYERVTRDHEPKAEISQPPSVANILFS